MDIENTGLPGSEKTARKRIKSGFTLVELIVVITILAILATVGFLTLSGYTDDARSATVSANVRTVYSAILTESTTSGNSPRYYIDHDPAAALSGGIVFVDGGAVALTGGQWGSGGTNYSAGNPRWDRLRMNGDKFRLSAVLRGMLGTAGFAQPAQAAYDTGAISVGAFDYVGKAGVSGKARTAAYFQVAGVSPGTKKASVTGNYTAVGTGAVAGLVKDPGSASSTGSIVESATVNSLPQTGACSGIVVDGAYYGGVTSYSVPGGVSTTATYAASPTANTCQFNCTNGTAWDGSACAIRNSLATDTAGWNGANGTCPSCVNWYVKNLGVMSLTQCETEAAKNHATMFYADYYQHPSTGTNMWRWRVHASYGVYSPQHSTHYESPTTNSYACGLFKQTATATTDNAGSGYSTTLISESSPWATGTANGYVYRIYRTSAPNTYSCSLFLRANGLNMYGKGVQSMLSNLTATMSNGINALCTHWNCGSSYGYLSSTSQTDVYGDSTGVLNDGYCYGYSVYKRL